jgi:enterochelin esterase-like enzyme
MTARALTEFLAGPRSRSAEKAFISTNTFPLVDGDEVTFVFRGHADAVHLRHWVYGLPSSQALARIDGTELWHLSVRLPPTSRVEYKFEVFRGGHSEWVGDALNHTRARDPFGSNSVAHASGYEVPSFVRHDPTAPSGLISHGLTVASEAFGEERQYSVYLPARYRSGHPYPLLVVHDGHDYLRYAALKTVLDNLIARHELPVMIVALTSSPNRLVEYAADPRHGRFVVEELLPHIEARFALRPGAQHRCLMGASFGAVAALATAWQYPRAFGRLLLQSGSFAFTDIGEGSPRGATFAPVVAFMNRFRAAPEAVSERVFMSCGMHESLIYENRSFAPVLQGTGMDVRFVEARDGHNWENWRDRLREGLSWLFPGPLLMMYE